jgi:lauroyl/myristoyl acyltransferase
VRDRLEELAGAVRRRIPTWLLPVLVRLRLEIAWRNEAVRADARTQMRFLLELTHPEADLDRAARAYVREQIWRGERRWHPELVIQQRVVGLEHLRSVGEGQGAVLSFMHHGSFDGLCASISRHGFAPFWMMAYPSTMLPDAPAWLRQHVKVSQLNGDVAVSTEIGAEGIVGLLADGGRVSLALDVPGHSRVQFAGREVMGASGAARLASKTSVPVVPATAERDAEGPFIRLHPPVRPEDFGSVEELHEHLLRLHERAVLAWPEAVDIPLSRWGVRPADLRRLADTA